MSNDKSLLKDKSINEPENSLKARQARLNVMVFTDKIIQIFGTEKVRGYMKNFAMDDLMDAVDYLLNEPRNDKN